MNINKEIDKLCRLCLAQENVKVNIFNKQKPYSEIYHKIASCLPIQISLNDELPKKICNSCSSKLNSFHEFYNSTLSAETQLIKWLNSSLVVNVSTNCDFNSIEFVKEELIESEEFSDNTVTSDFQFQETIHSEALTNKPKSEGNNSTNLTKMENSNVSESQQQKGKRPHTRSKLKVMTVSKEELKQKSLRLQKSPQCCKRKKSRKQDDKSVKKQLKGQQDTTVSCDVCNLKCNNTEGLALHSIQHSSDEKYTCPVCQYQTAVKHAMIGHARIMHDGTWRYKCEVCQKGFMNKTHASEHKYVHSGEKPFQCEVCGKSFTFSRALKEHRSTYHYDTISGVTKTSWDCTICNKQYKCPSGLRLHNINKHAETPVDKSVVCDMCGKRLASKSQLSFHSRIHTGYKPFECKFCSKCFTNKTQLQTHERTHTGEKPYVCMECGGRFTQRTSLSIHQRSHTGERPYLCKWCGKGFTSRSAMNSHSRSCVPN